jgi:hypothetical protein
VREGAAGAASAQRHTGLHRRRGERPLLTAIARLRSVVRSVDTVTPELRFSLEIPIPQATSSYQSTPCSLGTDSALK